MRKKEGEKEIRKCYACKKPVKGDALFCKACEKKPESRKQTMGTLVFYNKM